MTEFEEIKTEMQIRKEEERRKTQDEVVLIIKRIAKEQKQTREPANETVEDYCFNV